MDDDRTIQIALELELQGDDVRGTARCDGAPPRPFTGWLGLISVLDAIVAAPVPDDPDPG